VFDRVNYWETIEAIQDNAETAVKDLLKSVVRSVADQKDHKADLHAVEYMDDGSAIVLRVEIDGNEVRRNRSF
jgi:N-methylhydantoinase B/oxoprolinase/acetone carboxylase alpha subunit